MKVGQTDTANAINTTKKTGHQCNATNKPGNSKLGTASIVVKSVMIGKLNCFSAVCHSGKHQAGALKMVRVVEELMDDNECDSKTCNQ